MPGDGHQCGAEGPGDVTCTRLDGHGGSHTTYRRVGGQLQHAEWFACNPIGEPLGAAGGDA